MANGAKYPTHVPDRFEIRQGKFGPYFYDLEREADMPLEVVLDTLNRYSLRKQQLKFYVEKFGEMNSTTAPDAAAIRREVVEELAPHLELLSGFFTVGDEDPFSKWDASGYEYRGQTVYRSELVKSELVALRKALKAIRALAGKGV